MPAKCSFERDVGFLDLCLPEVNKNCGLPDHQLPISEVLLVSGSTERGVRPE